MNLVAWFLCMCAMLATAPARMVSSMIARGSEAFRWESSFEQGQSLAPIPVHALLRINEPRRKPATTDARECLLSYDLTISANRQWSSENRPKAGCESQHRVVAGIRSCIAEVVDAVAS
jgi:hypothetical protein